MADHQLVIAITSIWLTGEFGSHVDHAIQMVEEGQDIRLPTECEGKVRVEDLVMIGTKHPCQGIGTSVPNLLPIVLAYCAHAFDAECSAQVAEVGCNDVETRKTRMGGSGQPLVMPALDSADLRQRCAIHSHL